MRTRVLGERMAVRAVAGTHVVLLGMNVAKTLRGELLGFAIERHDHEEGERYFLRGLRTFEETGSSIPVGVPVSTREHPVQGFVWGDYTAKPRRRYTYRVVALTGKPKFLTEAESIEVEVVTEAEDEGSHRVWFNRGVSASQAYAARFKNRSPDDVPGGAALRWLGRGLDRALLDFIARAQGPGDTLHGAFYEFIYPPVLEAFKAAADRGATVEIVFDAKDNSSGERDSYPRGPNLAAITAAGLDPHVIRRDENRSYIAHNKFIVHGKADGPRAVWTGSTNITQGGLFGQLNCGHSVDDTRIARQYDDYFQMLKRDPPARTMRAWIEEQNAFAADAPTCAAIFSPRASLSALERYRDIFDRAQESVFLTAAFGINDLFEEVLTSDRDHLRYVLLEKADEDMEVIQRDPDNRFAIGNYLRDGAVGRWLRERLAPLNQHVRFIHTKYLLVDPLSKSPTIVTGSANFSDASTRNNDENMLLIQGEDPAVLRVADIYLGEFWRLFMHHAFRTFATAAPGAIERHLRGDPTWTDRHFITGSWREKERLLFSGAQLGEL